jgi:hypothetical protein
MIDPTSRDRAKLVGHTFRVRKNGKQETRHVITYTLGGGVEYRSGRYRYTLYNPATWDAWAKDAKEVKS